ncbi:YeiH family protein [Virgibacillus sp. AGTR]|uniref:YeiH family putative sulfate export transporter n=1 Tax=Virgibacillus salarius TaxID=447199 RepID=A0A941DTP0_9BACI|nr:MULTISPECIES: YeiH family protein [Virgibacillus]NAZ07908.1 putative sulfate exporter family transporter [Agaribacter marinus]MBR7795192.1 YeiH family putative sulfate export transporter [Virgibacillus salarius]MCC2249397.1 YeiH family protein [Virgibacillus sp. AGTR]MDY7043012.1 YeiH family protein [Virgibacillus sp. M23]QRZ18810.1 YeiH family putative sulfate export transporter [Virgibacillus sp. AGTR]
MGKAIGNHQADKYAFVKGVGITLLIAIIAKYVAQLPFLSIMGQLVIAIIIGMVWKATIGVRENLQAGVTFSNKKLLRFGIILLGMRLNLADIYNAGIGVFLIAAICLVVTLFIVYGLTKWFGVGKRLGILTACGTAICGAAAVVAIAPQVKAKDDETAVGAATVAVLGTIFTLIYTVLYTALHLSPAGYGVFTGATLHEVAHVVAAATAGGNDAVDLAVIVKLTRVALLVPVAIIIGYLFQRGSGQTESRLSMSIIPWFIIGFIAMSGFNTLGIVSEEVAGVIVNIAYLLIAMAMAGLGLNVDIKTFRKLGMKSFAAGIIGSVILAVLGYTLVVLFSIN